MASFSSYNFDELLPPYLTSPEKERLKLGLKQFFDPGSKVDTPNYSDFFLMQSPNYLMQSDLLHSIKMVAWDDDAKDFISGFTPAIFISSTCDIHFDNPRNINKKEALFAPIISVEEYCNDLKQEEISDDQIASFYNSLKKQEFSNLFYLPKNESNEKDYIAFFDKISWYPVDEIKTIDTEIDDIRFISLSNFGFYLFILKLSYHFCRVPEEKDRAEL